MFDTETTTDAAQRLRIGAYQLLKHGVLRNSGIFFDPDALTEEEVACLRNEAHRRGIALHRLDAFLEEILFKGVYETGGTIVGFNLPFDLSRLARRWSSARKNPRARTSVFRGGFTFELRPGRPHLRIKHVNRRMAFFGYAAPPKQRTARSGRKRQETNPIERGNFLDLATLGAALTGQTHSLESLAKLLGTPSRKTEGGDYGRALDAELIAYTLNDVQVTRECWEKLLERYETHSETGKPAHGIYSEASLGKAYLEAMGVRPWREVQPDFDPALIGVIMSSYYGGRSEVHIRREIVRTLYCDFASMYPTVCTLMGLWRFVIGRGMAHEDATAEVQAMLETIDVEVLRNPAFWPLLTVLVEVEPKADIFPVRAKYGEEPVATIGVNYLTSERPLWFTLADCLTSRLLTGRPPRIRRAVRFVPLAPQDGLRKVALAGDTSNRVDPVNDDFYRRVIDLRRHTQEQEEDEKEPGEKKRLGAHQLALKILANATSYGIFIEINVDDLDHTEIMALFEGDRARSVETKKFEAPGRYFHPLLATLITGAARLLLAVTERKLIDAGLSWAFCDTDSMAFAQPAGLSDADFEHRVRTICAWFRPLDPFENKGDVLEIEKQNFKDGSRDESQALYCYAISAKRYALFNQTAEVELVIRKASGHGLGYLLPPYDDPERERHETGVPVWQEDFWREIVRAGLAFRPDKVDLQWHVSLGAPAASQYTATAPDRLKPFRSLNQQLPESKRVFPFNFMLWFHARRPQEVVMERPDIKWSKRMRTPKPAAAYDKDPGKAAKVAFDRETGEHVEEVWLKSYQRALRTYARHPETKFIGGDHAESGVLRRRHVLAGPPTYIGKEADRWEEGEEFGVNEDSTIAYDLASEARNEAAAAVERALKSKACTHAQLARKAQVSEHTIARVRDAGPDVDGTILARLVTMADSFRAARVAKLAVEQELLDWARGQAAEAGRTAFAAKAGYDVANLSKILNGTRRAPKWLWSRLSLLREQC